MWRIIVIYQRIFCHQKLYFIVKWPQNFVHHMTTLNSSKLTEKQRFGLALLLFIPPNNTKDLARFCVQSDI